MMSNDNPRLGEAILAQVRAVKAALPLSIKDSIMDQISLPETSRPPGSVAVDLTCDLHGGRLVRLWMSFQAERTTFGGEGRKGAWDTETGEVVVVRCTWPGCRNSANLTSDWLVAHLRQVRSDFETGKGLPIAWFPLSKVGAPSR